jgi:hypothetical protein
MKIFGVSQSSGAERRLGVERGVDGVVLILADAGGIHELERVLVPADALLVSVTDPTPGGSTVEGTSPSRGARMTVGVEVRRNEVWIEAGEVQGPRSDVAVGLDDFQDALEAAIGRG